MSKPKYEIRPSGVWAGNRPMYDIISNGRCRITNFDRCRKSRYAEAVKIYNGKHNGRILTIRQDAPYSFDGKTVKDCNSMEPCNSLWAPDGCGDLSDFWRILEDLKAKQS